MSLVGAENPRCGLDRLIFVLGPPQVLWLPVLFHLDVGYRIIVGFRANRAAQAVALAEPPVTQS
jgi:hypothetical protein